VKRLVYLILLVLLIFFGCTNTKEEESPPADRLIVTYQTMPYSRLDGLGRVQRAVNAIAEEEIGVEVEFLTIDAQESFNAYPLWLSQGKQIDLMVLNYQDIQNYVKNGQLLSLDELLEQYGSGIKTLMESCSLASRTTMEGSIYGLALPDSDSVLGGGLWIPMRYLDEVGFSFMEEKIYSLEDVDALFAQLKERYPDKYPLGPLTSGGTFSTYPFLYGMQNPFGEGGASGSLDMKSGMVVNFYETKEYYEFLSRIRRWYQMGYIYPDAAYTGFSNVDLLRSREILSIPQISRPGIYTEDDAGEPLVCLRLSKIVAANSNSQGVFWVIPSTSKDPAGAMKFLNLMYTDQRVINLLTWGEEGKDYRFLDKSEGVIAYPDGIDPESAAYYNPLGLYGDIRLAYALNSNKLKEQLERYAAQATPIGSEYTGFLFDETPLATEIWQIRAVLARYLPVLESGCVDLDENYTAFLSALEEAGLNKVIAEKQRQLDTWLANRK